MGVIFVRAPVRRGPCRSVPVSAGFVVVCFFRIFHLAYCVLFSVGTYTSWLGFWTILGYISMIPILHCMDKCECIHTYMHACIYAPVYVSVNKIIHNSDSLASCDSKQKLVILSHEPISSQILNLATALPGVCI